MTWHERKYELLPTNRAAPSGRALYQLRALRDFEDVREGDLGGFVEGEHNLPHEGNAWIYGTATLYGHGYVADRGWLYPDFGAMEPYGTAWPVPSSVILPVRPVVRQRDIERLLQ
jgi:hypothetical protein